MVNALACQQLRLKPLPETIPTSFLFQLPGVSFSGVSFKINPFSFLKNALQYLDGKMLAIYFRPRSVKGVVIINGYFLHFSMEPQ